MKMTYRVAMPILAAMILAPAAALAHPGDHDNLAVGEAASHLMSSLFHLSVFAIAFCVLAVAFSFALKRRDRKSQTR
jgi:hypothetical protein